MTPEKKLVLETMEEAKTIQGCSANKEEEDNH
jgi:hypothetical protein